MAEQAALPTIGSFRGGKRERGGGGGGGGSDGDGSAAVERARGELRAFVQEVLKPHYKSKAINEDDCKCGGGCSLSARCLRRTAPACHAS